MEESEEAYGAIFVGFGNRHYYQNVDGGTCIRGKSCDMDVVCKNVLFTRGRIFSLVYMGIMVDVCDCSIV